MVNLFKRVKQANALYKRSREKGFTITTSSLMVVYRISNMLFNRYNIPELLVEAEIFDDETLPVYQTPTPSPVDKNVYIWVVPRCLNIWGGGHYTLFRFIDFFSKHHNIKNIIYLYNDTDEAKQDFNLQDELNKAFSTDKFQVTSNISTLPPCHVVFATTWESAYYAKRINSAHKFYFMQDYESLFYPGGSQALQANHTYSFGFHGITGGHWLKKNYESYGSKAHAYIFSADRNIFYPADANHRVKEQVKKIFFYGRPSTPRRAYELGIKALELISNQYPDIEIIIAGHNSLAPPKFKCTMLGNLTLKQTGELYRTCDLGIALSGTNMSYLPVELMASGCPVICNRGPQVDWFCQDEFNSLLVDPVPSSFLAAVNKLVQSKELRQHLVDNGIQTIQKTTWDDEMEKVYQYIKHQLNSLE